MPVNKKRPKDALIEQLDQLAKDKADSDFKAPKPPEIKERKWLSDEGQNNLLKQVALRIAPEGTEFIASLAVHVYKSDDELLFLTQATNTAVLNEIAAQTALKSLTLHTMRKYGHKPPAKVREAPLESTYENESKLIFNE